MIYVNPSPHDFARFKNREDFCGFSPNNISGDLSSSGISEAVLLKRARQALNQRHGLRSTFPAALFRDSGWEILLCCFISQLEGGQICVKQLHATVDESNTAMLRRLSELEAEGLTVRVRDASDARRSLVRLTSKGSAMMTAFLERYGSTDA